MKAILIKIAMTLLTETVAKSFIILFLEEFAKKTTNTIDDQAVAIIKKGLGRA